MLLLHIGSPKTGTTSLQRFLFENEIALRDRGINYMRAGRSHIAHNPLPISVAQRNEAAALAAIVDEYERAPEQIHVMSSEILFRMIVAGRLDTYWPEALRGQTRVLCYIRRQDHYAEAMYKQRVKNGLVTIDRAAFLQQQTPKLKYSTLIDRYAAIVGIENVLVRPFDRSRFPDGDVVADFAGTVLGLGSTEGLVRSSERANPTLSVELSEMLGRIAFDRHANVRMLIRELAGYDERDLFTSRDTFSTAQCRELMDGLAADNEGLRLRYLPHLKTLFDLSDLDGARDDLMLAPEAIARRAHIGALALARAMQSLQTRALETGGLVPETASHAPDTPPQNPAGPALPQPAAGTQTSSPPLAPEAEKRPIWFSDLCPAGPRTGFYRWLGRHGAAFVDRGEDQLIVTFDNLHVVGDTRPERDPWAAKFCADRGHSHLGVISQASDWFRDPDLITFLEGLAADGLFRRFRRVCFAGTSMGGFGALTFSALAPGSTVIAFSPQSTLKKDLVPWERRFGKGRAANWSLPYSDAAEAVASASQIYLIYDPFHRQDRAHADRLSGPNVTRLRAFGMGHKTALTLNRLDLLKRVLEEAITGVLAPADFYRSIRTRKTLYLYREAMAGHLAARGHPDRANWFRAAFKRQRRS
jgi:hypothetical protein